MCAQINLEVEINFITLRKTWFATAAQGKIYDLYFFNLNILAATI